MRDPVMNLYILNSRKAEFEPAFEFERLKKISKFKKKPLQKKRLFLFKALKIWKGVSFEGNVAN